MAKLYFYTVTVQLTSVMGVSIILLSPNFFHNPLLTCWSSFWNHMLDNIPLSDLALQTISD